MTSPESGLERNRELRLARPWASASASASGEGLRLARPWASALISASGEGLRLARPWASTSASASEDSPPRPTSSPYQLRYLSAFRTWGVPRPTSEIVVVCPSPDGLARDGTQEVGQALYYPAPGVPLVVGVTSTSREGVREREREPVRSLLPPREPPSRMALDLPFIDARGGSRRTMGGVAMR
jgi:hypothetical protein